MHFLVFTHLIEINSSDDLGIQANISMINISKFKSDDESLNNLIISGFNTSNSNNNNNDNLIQKKFKKNESHETNTYVCFCSENAAYYNYLIYYFPW